MRQFTTREALRSWAGTVALLEQHAYTKADYAEMENDISVRQVIAEFATLTPEEQRELDALDERFRRALYPALRKADVVAVYQHARYYFPDSEEYWWWHVEEGV